MTIYPKSLVAGDRVAIITPASEIKHKYVDDACEKLRAWGLEPVVSKHCKGKFGSLSGTEAERLSDIEWALGDPTIRAILCSRGGYGVVHLLEKFHRGMWSRDPKWVIGFSDISLLHAVIARDGVASIHSSMCHEIAEQFEEPWITGIRDILFGSMPHYEVEADGHNRTGDAEGTIVGGNLCVLTGVMGSVYEMPVAGNILFIEDVSEAIYRIERMLYTMRLSGVLSKVKGLVVGQFTDYNHPTDDFDNMYDMIQKAVADYDFPVAYNFPVGHVRKNFPIVEGADAHLSVRKDGVTLTLSR